MYIGIHRAVNHLPQFGRSDLLYFEFLGEQMVIVVSGNDSGPFLAIIKTIKLWRFGRNGVPFRPMRTSPPADADMRFGRKRNA